MFLNCRAVFSKLRVDNPKQVWVLRSSGMRLRVRWILGWGQEEAAHEGNLTEVAWVQSAIFYEDVAATVALTGSPTPSSLS
jgi:hypothetical protein